MQRQSAQICFVISGLAVALFLSGCGKESQSQSTTSVFEHVSDSKSIRVGYIVFPPTITKDPNTGALAGHFVKTINEIARQAGWQIQLIETDWNGFSAGLKSGRFDLSIAPTFVTIPRSLAVSFTKPLFYAGNSAIVRKGDNRFSDIKSFDQDGLTISVTQGEAGDEFAKSNFKHSKIRALPGPDETLAFQDVVAGRSDAALGDAYVTSKFAKSNPEVRDFFADNPYNLTPVSWAVAKSEYELLSFIDSAIEALETQGILLQYEREAGANWLHVKQTYVLDVNNTPPK
jgi:polar amino acid transport system substrate-binding protein